MKMLYNRKKYEIELLTAIKIIIPLFLMLK